MIKFNLDAPDYELVAHRGYPKRFPDNSLSGIAAVLEAGAKFLEIDVQLSTSGTVWLFHDESLERVCGQPGSLVELDDASVERLRASETERFGREFEHEPIARLTQVVELLEKHPDVFTFVEIKPCTVKQAGAALAVDAVAQALKKISDRVSIISFSTACLHAVANSTKLAHGLILESWDQLKTDAQQFDNSHIFCDYKKLPWDGSIDVGTKLAVYEVVDPPLARKLGARGAHFVETFAYPDLRDALKK